MRTLSILGAAAVSFALAVGSAGIADAAKAAKAPSKTKLGCVVGKEKWDASVGKCNPLPKKPAKAAKAAKPKK